MAYNPNIPAPTNRVQDDIAAMRGNFQHLAPLAQAVDELQAVSGLAQITDDLQAVSGLASVVEELQAVSELAQITDDLQVVSALAPYVQAILDSRIVEMGSNANGEYVRWENGLQVCFARVDTLGVPYTTAVGPLYARNEDYNWVFPSAFASPPRVIGLTERPFDNMRSFMTLTLVSSTSVTFRPILTVQVTGALLSVYANVCAIGRWK